MTKPGAVKNQIFIHSCPFCGCVFQSSLDPKKNLIAVCEACKHPNFKEVNPYVSKSNR